MRHSFFFCSQTTIAHSKHFIVISLHSFIFFRDAAQHYFTAETSPMHSVCNAPTVYAQLLEGNAKMVDTRISFAQVISP
jgi:hypothetical protein